ncbi:hypothetical protein MJO28_012739 [Puccinia striiformis f. sp. tritici]|uniref:Uncharacterized protein n=1 Tax=Puccinia striiformis f. sp. tritici TaxID=168172 RepID=A0ACC0E1C1_9BASI|nr:hypothetical protein MJO28_012739 [Puccinia striiformis f. sp. tritici]
MVSVALAVPLAETPLGDTAIAIAGHGRRCRRSVERSTEIKEVLAAKDLENFAQETGSDVIKKESLGGTTRDDIGSKSHGYTRAEARTISKDCQDYRSGALSPVPSEAIPGILKSRPLYEVNTWRSLPEKLVEYRSYATAIERRVI